MLNSKNIDINDQFKRALDIMENSGRSVFLMGRAGTGKSTLLEYFRGITKKRTVVLAPTGVAAMNVKGQTIHSFFKFKPDITIEKVRETSHGDATSIYKRLETIVIDEISMVRSDLLDCVDRFMRLNGNNAADPFGGAQMVFIGDLCQLPPIVTPQESGIFGILFGLAGTFLIMYVIKLKMIVVVWALILAFTVSLLIGVISGVYPAMRAVNLDPIEALRYE